MGVRIELNLDKGVSGIEYAQKFAKLFNENLINFEFSKEITQLVISYSAGFDSGLTDFLWEHMKDKIVWQRYDETRVILIDRTNPLNTTQEDLVFSELCHVVLEAILILKKVGFNDARITILYEKCTNFFSSQNYFLLKLPNDFLLNEGSKSRIENQNENLVLTYYLERTDTLSLEILITLLPFISHGEKYEKGLQLNRIIISLNKKINRLLNDFNVIHKKHKLFRILISLVDPESKLQNIEFQMQKNSELIASRRHKEEGKILYIKCIRPRELLSFTAAKQEDLFLNLFLTLLHNQANRFVESDSIKQILSEMNYSNSAKTRIGNFFDF